MKSLLISFLLLLAIVSNAKDGKDLCSTTVVNRSLSDAAKAWLVGEITADDHELQTQAQIRLYSGQEWTERRFSKEVFSKLKEVMLEAGEHVSWEGYNYFGRPARLAELLFRVSRYSTVLNSRQREQLEAHSRSPKPFQVKDWGQFDNVQDFLFGVAAVLAEPQYRAMAMTGAFLHRDFFPPKAFQVWSESGALLNWSPSEKEIEQILTYVDDVQTLPFHPSFRPILLTNPAIAKALEKSLGEISGSGRAAAINLSRYIFENQESSKANVQIMRLFHLAIVNYSTTAISVGMPGYSKDFLVLDLAVQLGLQSSR